MQLSYISIGANEVAVHDNGWHFENFCDALLGADSPRLSTVMDLLTSMCLVILVVYFSYTISYLI
jgi:hypothetical protein